MGQKFVDASNFEYTVFARDDKAYVRTTTGDYELHYGKSTKTWYIIGTTGTYELKPIGG